MSIPFAFLQRRNTLTKKSRRGGRKNKNRRIIIAITSFVAVLLLVAAVIIFSRSDVPDSPHSQELEQIYETLYNLDNLTLEEVNELLPNQIGCVSYSGMIIGTPLLRGQVNFEIHYSPDDCALINSIEVPTETEPRVRKLMLVQEYLAAFVLDFMYEHQYDFPEEINLREISILGDAMKVFLLPPEYQSEMGVHITLEGSNIQWDGYSMPGCELIIAANVLSEMGRINPGGVPQLLRTFDCEY